MADSSAIVTFRRLGREFGRLDAEEIQDYLDDALLELDTTAYGNNIERAQVYMACHLLKMSRLSEENVAMPTTSDPDADLKMTRYGRSLLRLRAQAPQSAPDILTILTI